MSLTKVTYSMINGASVNVLDFGAKGDGTTDDSSAIQSAITSLSSGGVLVFPAGTYITTNVNISASVTLQGNFATLQKKTGATYPIFNLLSANVTFDSLAFNGDRFNQSGSHADNIVNHRQCSAISTGDAAYANTKFINCNFYSFYNGAVCVIGDNLSITNTQFSNNNTGNLFAGYNSTDATVYCNGITITSCLFKNSGLKTSSGDTRQYGNSLPVVTADAVLIRGANVVFSNNTILECDRNGIKFEFPRFGVVVSNNVIRNTYAGDSAFHAIQAQGSPSDFTASASNPNNWVISGNVVQRPTGLLALNTGLMYGVSASNNSVYAPSGGSNALVQIDMLSGSGNININNNQIVAGYSVAGIKFNFSSAATMTNVNINGNYISTSNRGIYLGATNTTLDTVRICNNNSVTGSNSLYADDATLNNFVITDNQFKDMAFNTGANTLRTNFVIARNVFETYEESYISSVMMQNNIVKTVSANNRGIIGLLSTAVGPYYDTDNGGELYTLTALSATPSVQGRNQIYANNASATSITNFTGAVSGQEITIYFSNSNTTINNGATIKLAGAANFVGTALDILTLYYIEGVGWVEKSRSVN